MALRRICQKGAALLQQPSLVDELTTSPLIRRLYSTLPEDLAEIAKRSKFPTRKNIIPPGGQNAATEAAAAAAAETAAENANLAKEGAKIASVWMAPWERRQLEGGAIRPWEKAYWGVFVLAIALFLFNRLPKSEVENPEVDSSKEERKAQMARLVLAGGSVLGDDLDELAEDDPFDGLSPEEIQEYVLKATGASLSDPFEGMSPDEINEYVKKHGLTGA